MYVSVLNEMSIDKKSPAWKLKPKSNERFLVLASCSDLAVFSLGEKSDYSFNTGLGGMSYFRVSGMISQHFQEPSLISKSLEVLPSLLESLNIVVL